MSGQRKKMPTRAIVAVSRLPAWGGSEVVACEMAESLIERGLRVEVFAYAVRPEQRQYLEGLGAKVRSAECELDISKFDLVYCHHQLASHLLFRQLLGHELNGNLPVFVYNHLSPYESMEMPGPLIEAKIADVIWCNSVETQRVVNEFGPRFSDTVVVPNPAPDRFFASRSDNSPHISSLLIVSNHIPPEMVAALVLLEREGVRVTRIGYGHIVRRVEPQDFLTHDAVISIGKSVQYALASATPVYCYDHFGGPGWLTNENLATAQDSNFSGRSHPRKLKAATIAADIKRGYRAAAVETVGISRGAADQWRLSRIVDDLVDFVQHERHDPARSARLRDVVGTSDFRRNVIAEGHVQENFRRELIQRMKVEDRQQKNIKRPHKSLLSRLNASLRGRQ